MAVVDVDGSIGKRDSLSPSSSMSAAQSVTDEIKFANGSVFRVCVVQLERNRVICLGARMRARTHARTVKRWRAIES